MELARAVTLPDYSVFHYVWRTVNGKGFMRRALGKVMFLNSFFAFYFRAWDQVAVYAFCVMSNHYHMVAELMNEARHMSRWAHSSHTSFAQKINKVFKRRGPVGMSRFKSVIAENTEALMHMMFYNDWNPVVANIVRSPAQYRYSSYRFYAFGEKNEWTKHLTIPHWYTDLADNDAERREIYQELSFAWWELYGDKLKTRKRLAEGGYAGSDRYMQIRENFLRAAANHARRGKWTRMDVNYLAAISLSREPARVQPVVNTTRWKDPIPGPEPPQEA